MTPVYFPFTYISDQTASALYACFNRIAVCQASRLGTPPNMKQLAQEGVIDLRIPVEKDDETLMAACKEYRAWGDLHQENGRTVFKTRSGAVPFFDDSLTQKIRTDIEHEKNEAPPPESPAFTARVFIQIAQEFDQQQDELAREFASIDTREQDLFNQLTGDAATAPDDKIATGSSNIADDYMIRERVTAWLDLMKHDGQTPGFYITGSRSAWDLITDLAPDAETVFDLPSIPIPEDSSAEWPRNMGQYLDTLTCTPWPLSKVDTPEFPDAGKTGQQMIFKLSIIPGSSPEQFFSRFLEPASTQNNPRNDSSELQNTLVGLVVLL